MGDEERPAMRAAAIAMRGGCCEMQRSGCVAAVARVGSAIGQRAAAGPSGGHCAGVAPELEQVVGGVGEPPFGSGGGSAAAEEAIDAAVELGVGEDGLDH